ncbi:MAG: hypothetical protein GX092_00145 [Clostridia bacterium]|jgi:multicomponent Na+:H+ antiporter subunit B|nr:hypothetical protein [Clostridia bacterium]
MKLMRIGAFVFLLFMIMLMFISSGSLPPIYDPNSPAATHIADRYIEQAVAETGTTNMVTAVLADYRGYDTLGETTVIFTAGLVTVFLLRTTQKTGTQGAKTNRQQRR